MLSYFSDCVSVSKKIIQILTNHHFTNALFKTHSKLFLLKPGDTRFYSAYIAVRRLLRCQSAVQKTVVSEEWNEWGSKRDYRDKARYVNKAVLNAAFWTAIAHFCYVLKPIVRLLRLVDSNMPSMSKVPDSVKIQLIYCTSVYLQCNCEIIVQVYPECCAIETHIESTKMPDDVKQDVLDIFRNRWDKMHSPLHSVGYMLEPQFQGTDFGSEVSRTSPLVVQFAQLLSVLLCITVCIVSVLQKTALLCIAVCVISVLHKLFCNAVLAEVVLSVMAHH